MMSDLNYYEILGVSSDASIDDIKKAYFDLALKHHPDRVIGNDKKKDAHDKFILIGTAYEILSHNLKKEQKSKCNFFNDFETDENHFDYKIKSPFNKNNNTFKHFENLFKEHSRVFNSANNTNNQKSLCKSTIVTSKTTTQKNGNIVEITTTEDDNGNTIETIKTIRPKTIK